MSASASICSLCRKEGVAFKKCAVCRQAEYCGVECQKADWKKHKKTCAPHDLPLPDVWAAVKVADATSDNWRGVLKWEGRMEELLTGQPDPEFQSFPDEFCSFVLATFSLAHIRGEADTRVVDARGSRDHVLSVVRLEKRMIDLLGKMERFRDQGKEMCVCAQYLKILSDKQEEAAKYYQLARAVGATHGFFSVECQACMGLGMMAIIERRHEEGVELLQNALAAASLSEDEPSKLEVQVCYALTGALFKTNSFDELDVVVPKYREASKAESRRLSHPCLMEMNCLLVTARLHEARGRTQEAARDVRSLLELLHDIERRRAAKQDMPDVDPQVCQILLQRACEDLKLLRPVRGDKELIKAVKAELAKLQRLA